MSSPGPLAGGLLLGLLACLVVPPARAVATNQAEPAVVKAAEPAAPAASAQRVSPYALAARRQAQAQAQARGESSTGLRVSPLTQHRPHAPVNRGLQR